MLVYMLETGNIFGWDGVDARSHAWSNGWYWRIAWVTDSSVSPHLRQILSHRYGDDSNFLWHLHVLWLAAM